jgi:hypothetical protein
LGRVRKCVHRARMAVFALSVLVVVVVVDALDFANRKRRTT